MTVLGVPDCKIAKPDNCQPPSKLRCQLCWASEEGEFPQSADRQLVRRIEAGKSFFPGPAVSILPGGKIEALIGIIDSLAESISGLQVVPSAEGSSQGYCPAVIAWNWTLSGA